MRIIIQFKLYKILTYFIIETKKFNEKTDVWAFGVIVWQCLCPIQTMESMIAERIHVKETGNLMPHSIRALDSQAANI